MARGFESKDVEYQQAEASRADTPHRALTAEEREAASRRRTLELALARTRADLASATSASYRTMLARAIADLEAQLARIGALVIAVAIVLAAAACGSHADARSDRAASAFTASTSGTSGLPPAEASARPRVVALGDSLTAGLGLAPDQAYPALLQQRIDSAGLDYQVINAGVSGDTSAGGLSRLDWALEGDVRVLIVALGGNDALRALPTGELEHNLGQIIERAQARHITVVLAGMEAPPNWGRDYVVQFHKIYPALAARYHVPLVPFLLEGVAGDETLNQRDGIHPTAAGARIVADNVWSVLGPVVEHAR